MGRKTIVWTFPATNKKISHEKLGHLLERDSELNQKQMTYVREHPFFSTQFLICSGIMLLSARMGRLWPQ